MKQHGAIPNELLGELLVTKICHDLAGPVGAINNGIEFLKESGKGPKDDFVDLIAISAGEGIARLLLLRKAFGLPSQQLEQHFVSVRDMLAQFLIQKNVMLHCPEEIPVYFQITGGNPFSIKFLLNAIMVVADILLKGGEITINAEESALVIKGKGKLLKNTTDIDYYFQSGQLPIDPDIKNIQLYYTHYLLQKIAIKATVAHTEEEISITLA